ncbi:MAG TPA: Gfo/Idh/MocA family oxidoreductase [Thermotogota bacterium]|jgi:predicted dehydrogenase|nr:Gfo/Idh/MocA family oxidoreductase [Thermotogota bacterium]NLH20106.1 Gfo/Idh/MocA family oxidoreductase [Thermotogaceae bacterium]OQC31022.1 MAG: putative oxidoreductase YteT precursor [Thermotogota bacterium ADurb.Bin062]HNW47945.1 Gfo/Idh/MocA family oxidoreductase [Thermotogota bacterium]HNY81588.1 Gfo/Idh/MocA family oxidoreductase [Thermotogota bacterium]
MRPITAVLVGAGNRGTHAYGDYALLKPESLRIVAVADPDGTRRKRFQQDHQLPDKDCFSDWKPLLNEKRADLAIIATMDRLHAEPALLAMEKGYDIILEKPMATTLEGCRQIVDAAKETGRMVSVAHVLRYTTFFSKIRGLLDGGRIGRLLQINLTERIGYYHMAHSYVRGNWANSQTTAPIILTKSSHDLDILYWLIGEPCRSVYSEGGLVYFRKQNHPKGAGERCLSCGIERDCPYSAKKIYLELVEDWPIARNILPGASFEEKVRYLETGPYGRCVFLCDNDVADRQTVLLDFGETLAVFNLTAFSAEKTREIDILGTDGDIKGNFERGWIEIRRYGGTTERITIPQEKGHHAGGDYRLLDDVIKRLRNADKDSLSSPEESLHSHEIAFACETSRREKRPVTLRNGYP